LEVGGAALDAIYFCPHHPDDGCGCRKPAPGLIEQAVREHAIDLARAYVIGDHARDVQLAKRVGVKSIFVTTGHESEREQALLTAERLPPDAIAASLGDAAAWILADAQRREPSCLMPHGVSS
jgi:heptosyltransferase-2